jgi:hypothetical protein
MNVEKAMMRGDFISHETLPIWTKCIREGVGICIRTPTIFIQSWALQHPKELSTSKKLMKSMGYKYHSQLTS